MSTPQRAGPHSLVHLALSLNWRSHEARHSEVRHVPRFNVWRDLDLLPPPLRHAILDHAPGDCAAFPFEAGRVVPSRRQDAVHELPATAFVPGAGTELEPREGRFYPRGMLRGLPGVFRGDMRPARLVGRDGDRLRLDLNHPLAGLPLEVSLRVVDVAAAPVEHGGRCDDALEALTEGPGLQARYGGRPTDFYADAPWARADERPDAEFYRTPRMVSHLDATARAQLEALHRTLLPPGGRVLDLMASWDSHLEGVECAAVAGLGLNAAELEANPRLGLRLCHDLNSEPVLPFGEAVFDAVVCTAAVEYLIQPAAVFREVARVLRPGGLFLVTFSNRWFPPKAIRLWGALHEFERLGLVSDYFLASGRFADLHTRSLRGLPRPADDPHLAQTALSDPLYAVWAWRDPA